MAYYLIGVERPCGEMLHHIKVSDDVEGFGPGLLAVFPLELVEADTPELAAYRYARAYALFHTGIVINLPTNDEEWWMEMAQAHRVDTGVEPVWEPDKEKP